MKHIQADSITYADKLYRQNANRKYVCAILTYVQSSPVLENC